MNFNNWTRGKKLLAAFIGVFFLVGIVVTIYLVQKQQETQSHAEKATVITLSPPNQSASSGQDVHFDLILNPGTNQVNFIKFTVRFDPNKFSFADIPQESAFDLNDTIGLVPTGEAVLDETNGTITRSFTVGSDPTKVLQSETTIGTVTLRVKPSAQVGQTDITVDKDASQIRSVGGSDAFNENVLNQTVGASVAIVGGQCVPNQATCSWDASTGATSYHYQVIKSGDSEQVIAEGDTSDTSVTFDAPVKPGESVPYICKVTALNQCGTSAEASGQSTCAVPSETPTPTPTTTVTGTPTPTLTVTPTFTPTPTTPQGITPTTPIVQVVTATPGQITEIAQGPTSVPAPTLPATGNPVVTGGIIGGILFVLGGLALLFL